MQDQINGYNIISSIGVGSFGEVFLCQKEDEEINNKKYAVKRLYQNADEFEEGFLNETENMKKISSDYIVKYIEHFKVNNKFFIVMEYFEGGTLFDYIFKKGYFQNRDDDNDSTVFNIFAKVLIGLHILHENGIIHRDLTPKNIILNHNLELKIGDLGLSKYIAKSSEEMNTNAGALAFQSPEMANEGKYTKKTDIWSLGCIFYMLITKHEMYQNCKTPLQLAKKVLNSDFQPIPDNVDEDMKNLLYKLLNKNPSKRPNTKDIIDDNIFRKKIKEYSELKTLFTKENIFIRDVDPPKEVFSRLGKIFFDLEKPLRCPNCGADQNRIFPLILPQYQLTYPIMKLLGKRMCKSCFHIFHENKFY